MQKAGRSRCCCGCSQRELINFSFRVIFFQLGGRSGTCEEDVNLNLSFVFPRERMNVVIHTIIGLENYGLHLIFDTQNTMTQISISLCAKSTLWKCHWRMKSLVKYSHFTPLYSAISSFSAFLIDMMS